MNSCAFGPCEKSKERGGAGCYMCDVVAKGRVTYHTEGPCKRARRLGGEGCECDKGKGHTIFAAQRPKQKQLENITTRDKKLTDTQRKNQEAAAKKT